MTHFRNGAKLGVPLKKRPDSCRIAEKNEFNVTVQPQGAGGTGDDDFRTMVASHSIERNAYWLYHGPRDSLSPAAPCLLPSVNFFVPDESAKG
jgi:hypothetical protein